MSLFNASWSRNVYFCAFLCILIILRILISARMRNLIHNLRIWKLLSYSDIIVAMKTIITVSFSLIVVHNVVSGYYFSCWNNFSFEVLNPAKFSYYSRNIIVSIKLCYVYVKYFMIHFPKSKSQTKPSPSYI